MNEFWWVFPALCLALIAVVLLSHSIEAARKREIRRREARKQFSRWHKAERLDERERSTEIRARILGRADALNALLDHSNVESEVSL